MYDIFEITGFQTGVSRAGVNYLQPQDAYQEIRNGFIYRQVLQSRKGVGFFTPRLTDETRVFGIFEHTLVNGDKELLAIDQNFLYKYNTGTGVFDQIPFGGSMAGYTGFAVSAKDLYVSGVSYPDSNNGNRFIFVSEGFAASNGSSIFFYDGTNVLDYTDTTDNPDYAPPPQGALQKARYVLWFNGRLNFVAPTIASQIYNQGVLYSGIRNAAGDGDKFNVPGSGLFEADTYQVITGATILGQILVLNFNRMAYTLERTQDAFNPYFGRAVPGVLGTNANFSAVSWDDSVRSLGKTGVLATDGRQNPRIDNKIPYFTADEIDQLEFNLTYGGFDRINNQFLWLYKEEETESDTQNRALVSNYEEGTWSVYDVRFSVLGQTDLGLNLTWDDIDETGGNESWAAWDTTEELWNRIGIELEVQKTLAGDDLGFIYQLNQDYDDYFSNISSVVTGATTTLNISASGILAGDLLTVSNVLGMIDINGNSGINNFDPDINLQVKPFYNVISATDTSLEINLDSRELTPYISGGHVSVPINFYAKTIPFNPYRSQGMRCYISHVEFLIDTNGGSLLLDVTMDEQESPFIQNVLCKPTITTQAREWITVTIDQEANFVTFILKQQSPSVQLRLTNMRIHCSPAGFTSY